MRRALAFFAVVLLATSAGAATTTPLVFELMDPLEYVVETYLEDVLQDSQTLSGGTVDWTAPSPLMSGAARFEVEFSPGRIALASTGSFAAPTDIGQLDYDVKATLSPAPRIQIDVPDFGESMTRIVIVGDSSLDLSRTGGRVGYAGGGLSFGAFSSALLGPNVQASLRSNGFFAQIPKLAPDTFSESETLYATIHSFPAGDTVIVDMPVSFSAGCNTLAGTATDCSVTWDGSAELRFFALVPEAQSKPMTQCFDAIDNDLDGAIDLEDGDCSDPWDTTEGMPPPMTGGCGMGPELALALPLLLALRRRRRATA